MSEKDTKGPSSDAPSDRGPRVITFGASPKEPPPEQGKVVPRVIAFGDTTEPPESVEAGPKILTFSEPPPPPVPQVLGTQPRTIAFGGEITHQVRLKNQDPHVFRYLPGAEMRKRIEVSVDDLRLIDTDIQGEDVLKASQELVETFNFEDGQDTKFITWGQECLEDYTAVVQGIFHKLHTDATLAKLAEVRIELAEALGKLSWKKLQNGGWFSDPDPDEVRQKFSIGYEAVKPLIAVAEALKPKLLEWKSDVEEADAKIKSLILKVSAHIVAGTYLVAYGERNISELRQGTAHQLPIMRDRVAVLRTQLIIMLDDQLYQSLRSQALDGYAVVVNTLGVDIPRWQMLTLTQITQPQADRSVMEEISSQIRKALTTTK